MKRFVAAKGKGKGKERAWAHVACGQWVCGVRLDVEANQLVVQEAQAQALARVSTCYLCGDESARSTLRCAHADCDRSFHALCGLQADCHVKAQHVQMRNSFEFVFLCKRHRLQRYVARGDVKVQLSSLGQHLLAIDKLRCKLRQVDALSERIRAYQLNERGLADDVYAINGKYKAAKGKDKEQKKEKGKVSKLKRASKTRSTRDDVISASSEYEETEKERAYREHRRQKEKAKEKQQEKSKEKSSSGDIQMATDIWAGSYHGGEIKLVERRDGVFLSIPRLRLPKGNKFRYSHRERREREQLLKREMLKTRTKDKDKDKGQEQPQPQAQGNAEWNSFLQKIKETEMTMRSSEGGQGWTRCDGLKQPAVTDYERHKAECPYCRKLRLPSTSNHGWSRHLNARHVFKCNRCGLYWNSKLHVTRHLATCKQ